MSTSTRLRSYRNDLYNALLDVTLEGPRVFVRNLCEHWSHVSNAAFAELWLHNSFTDSWELLDSTYDGDDLPHVFPDVNNDTSSPIIDYCCDSGKFCLVQSLDEVRKWNGRIYSVANRDEFSRAGYSCFLAVPLVAQANASPKNVGNSDILAPPEIEFRACLCLHFDNLSRYREHPDTTIELMARVSSHALLRSYESQQRDVLLTLNGLSEKYSIDGKCTPREILSQYLNDLLSCIASYMNAIGVTLFFREDDEKFIRCIATTGLADQNRMRVTDDKLPSCRYRYDDECWTAQVYRSGIPHVATAEDADQHNWRYTEVDPQHPTRLVGKEGSVMCPILRPSDDGPKKSLGVIRCAGLRNAFGTMNGTVNPVGIQTLGLIAQQVGPYIDALTERIKREDTIALLKHDMLSPINLIWNTVDRLETLSLTKPQDERVIKFNDLMNIKYSAELARTLLPQLSFDPGEVNDFSPERVNINLDVISYLKHQLAFFAERENSMSISYDDNIRQIPALYVDKMLIQRTIFNIILNAVKYGRKSSRITIRVVEDPSDYVIAIANDGIGIMPAEHDLIFQQGYRSKNARKRSNGTGHGLYVGKRAMMRHNGDLRLHSPDSPTEFHLVFPAILSSSTWWEEEND